MPIRPRFLTTSLVMLCFLVSAAGLGMDHLVVNTGGRETTLEGRVVVQAQDGGLLLLARDGLLWPVQPNEIVKSSSDQTPFAPLDMEGLSRRLLAELPRGFDTFRTAHYLICFNTTREYAQWCGALFEQLYKAFDNYWTKKGFTITPPEFPLVAVVFADRRNYIEYARPEAGDGASSIIGYYSLQTNRMTMCDLTGVESFPQGKPKNVQAQINAVLSRPDAERTVATIMHEATHQIAFNCGLHQRMSDTPLWFCEGIAIYFETPDLAAAKGWRNIGGVNRMRLQRFRQYLRGRPSDSLRTLVADDKRFRDPQRGLDAYAEAWALTYFLIRQKPKQYVDYVRVLSAKPPLREDGPEKRLAEFTAAFGDLSKLDAEFLRYMAKVQ
mgnify:CR=1 FL=1